MHTCTRILKSVSSSSSNATCKDCFLVNLTSCSFFLYQYTALMFACLSGMYASDILFISIMHVNNNIINYNVNNNNDNNDNKKTILIFALYI